MKIKDQKLVKILQSSPDAITVTNLQAEITECNQASLDMHGYSSEKELIGKNSFDLIIPEDRAKARKNMELLYEKETLKNLEYTLIRKDGSTFDAELSVGSIRDSAGNINGFVGITKNITERKRMEKDLRESENKYRLLAENITDTISLHKKDGKFFYISPSCKATGFEPEDFIGKYPFEFYHPEDAEYIREALKKKGGIIDNPVFRFRFRKKDGSYTWIEVKNKLIVDPKTKEEFVLSVSRDISVNKEAEEQIENDLKEKKILLQEIHHRVKNNMQIISSLLSIQAGYIHDERDKAIFQESHNRVYSMAIVHEQLYRSDDLSSIDFHSYINKAVKHLLVSYGIDHSRIGLRIDIEKITMDINLAIPCALLINEIVTNSFKYAFPNDRKGEISIGLSFLKNKYELIVSDNGVGLPDGFDLKNAKTLGLQLIDTISQQIRSEMTIDNKNGTKYTFLFAPQELKAYRKVPVQ